MKLFSFWKKKSVHTPHSSEPLFLYNTLHGEKELFVPRNPKSVKMYNCGPTVYDHQHLGNLRSYIFADILKRTLLYNNFTVSQVINITDVGHLTGENEGDADHGEDKVERGAKKAGLSTKKLVESITREFKGELEKLNIKTSNILFTKATDYIKDQIALVKTLEEKGYTYTTKDGVYYDTSKFHTYGELGNVSTMNLKEGARVEINPEKKHLTDFALWKLSPPGEKREQEWDSPWGVGFPGWHVECTAMIFAELGRQIDIHTGGIDHIHVHHNNEIAQAEAITKKQYVKYWLHNAFITIEGKKISKSIGNTILLRQVEDKGIAPLAYRYWLLTGHYRNPMNFTWEALGASEIAFSRLLRLFVEKLGTKNGVVQHNYKERFHKHINDDLDTPGAFAVLWELVRDENIKAEDKRVTLLDFDKVLGLGLIEGHRKLIAMLKSIEKKVATANIPKNIRNLLQKREEARAEKKWEEADKLRTAIEDKGYVVIDTDSSSQIEKKG